MKFGFQIIRRHLNFFESQDPARGFFNFDGTFTNQPNVANTGNTIASHVARLSVTGSRAPFCRGRSACVLGNTRFTRRTISR